MKTFIELRESRVGKKPQGAHKLLSADDEIIAWDNGDFYVVWSKKGGYFELYEYPDSLEKSVKKKFNDFFSARTFAKQWVKKLGYR